LSKKRDMLGLETVFNLVGPSVLGHGCHYYDARSWIILHIASSTADNGLRSQLKKDFQSFKNLARTTPEKRIVSSVGSRLIRRPAGASSIFKLAANATTGAEPLLPR